MLKRFFPDLYLKSIYDIDLGILTQKKIKGIILDIDNTLVPNFVKDADDKVIEWIERAKKLNFKICIVSNASFKRVDRFNKKLNLFAIHRARKPSQKSLLSAVKEMGIEPKETAIVGDQVFTDIYGGNRLNMFTVLVEPMDREELFLIKLKRFAEKIVLYKYDKIRKS